MLCPACGVDMFVLEFERVEVDYCYRCGGVWLDSGELELIGQRAGSLQMALLQALEAEKKGRRRAGRRRCPLCRAAMEEVTVQTSPPIVVDRCPYQDGLWFDKGELCAVVEAAGAPEGNVLARFFAGLGAQPAPGNVQ